jgi:RNA polymerase sigma-70 factor (ECF subfamily)
MPPTLDIDQLYRRYGPLVLRRIRGFFRDPAEAEDVLQEVFVRVIENMDSFRGSSRPSTWLYSVTTRHCLNRLRDSKRRRELLDEHGSTMGWGASVGEAQQPTRLLLKQLWRELDPELLEVAVYYEVDGMSHGQIAELTGVSRRTVGNRLAQLAERARDIGGGAE